jgi:DNA-binding transcriptional LysR family regulator
LSYQVLEQWANLGIGAAVLPKSKLTSKADLSLAIIDKAGQPVAIEFEAVWSNRDPSAAHLANFAKHLREVVPKLIEGLV